MKKMNFIAVLLISLFSAKAQGPLNTIPNTISVDDRLFGLSQVWAEAKYNFVYYDKLAVDWDSLYRSVIPKARDAKNDLDYYNVLRHFAAQLQDGHTGVWYPMSYYETLAQYAPLKTSLIQGRVFITAVLNDSLASQGIEKGMEIMRINGMDVFEYANTYVSPFEGTSTAQGQNMMVYSTYLLNGPAEELLKLTLKNKKGAVADYFISRKIKKKTIVPVSFSETKEGTGILSINSFDSKNFNQVFDSIYPLILKTKALVIDLRENGGGDGAQGLYLLKHLATKPFSDPLTSYRQYLPLYRSWGIKTSTYQQFGPDKNLPFTDRSIYEKPVVVLIGKQTYSAAEDFTMLFDHMKRGMIIGQPSGGSTGQPMFTKLPGGGTFRVCIKKDTYPDGKEFVGVGIQPGILVPENAASFIKGEDVVLNRALNYLADKSREQGGLK